MVFALRFRVYFDSLVNSFRKHLVGGIHAARVNLVPGALLWLAALFIIVAYRYVPPAAAGFAALAQMKLRYGYCYSALSTSFWAGLVPLLLARLQRGGRCEPASRYPFLLAYWAVLGLIIDAFYRWQAFAWGDNAHLSTLLLKIFCDLGVFTPVFAMPLSVIIYAWKDGGFRAAPVRALLHAGWYGEHVMPVLISCWMVWAPTLLVVYALPLDLQLPIQNLIECLWVLMLMVLTNRSAAVPGHPAANVLATENCDGGSLAARC
jgi:hypothetical protein